MANDGAKSELRRTSPDAYELSDPIYAARFRLDVHELKFTQNERLLTSADIFLFDNGSFVYYDLQCRKVFTKSEGEEISVVLPDGEWSLYQFLNVTDTIYAYSKELLPCVDRAAAYPLSGCSSLQKIYAITQSSDNKISVDYVRDINEGETIHERGFCSRVRNARKVMYRMCDDPESDGIDITDIPEKMKPLYIHRDKIIFELEKSGVKGKKNYIQRYQNNAFVLEVYQKYGDNEILSYASRDSPFVYIIDGRTIHFLEINSAPLCGHNDDEPFVPSMRINYSLNIRSIFMVDRWGKLSVDGCHEHDRRIMSAELPHEYVETNGYIGLLHCKLDETNKKVRRLEEEVRIRSEENLRLRETIVGRPTADIRPRDKVEDFSSKFSCEFGIKKILGVGGFGIVFEATNSLDDCDYAVKRISIQPSLDTVDKALREVRAMAQLDHPGIIRYNGTWIERPPTSGWQREVDQDIERRMKDDELKRIPMHRPDTMFIYIQMQLCMYSLAEWLEKNNTVGDRETVRMKSWFRQIVVAVQYLHDNSLIHRDLKPKNILFVDDNRLKICDLGIVTPLLLEDGKEVAECRSDVGSPLYMAPEQMWNCSSKVDVYSLGLIFLEMCIAMTQEQKERIFSRIRTGKPLSVLHKEEEAITKTTQNRER